MKPEVVAEKPTISGSVAKTISAFSATVAAVAAGRTGNRRNPRPASAEEIERLLASIY